MSVDAILELERPTAGVEPLSAEALRDLAQQKASVEALYYEARDVERRLFNVRVGLAGQESLKAGADKTRPYQTVWDEVVAGCKAILRRKWDLEVATWLLHALCIRSGFRGMHDGLQVIQQIFAEGDEDCTTHCEDSLTPFLEIYFKPNGNSNKPEWLQLGLNRTPLFPHEPGVGRLDRVSFELCGERSERAGDHGDFKSLDDLKLVLTSMERKEKGKLGKVKQDIDACKELIDTLASTVDESFGLKSLLRNAYQKLEGLSDWWITTLRVWDLLDEAETGAEEVSDLPQPKQVALKSDVNARNQNDSGQLSLELRDLAERYRRAQPDALVAMLLAKVVELESTTTSRALALLFEFEQLVPKQEDRKAIMKFCGIDFYAHCCEWGFCDYAEIDL